MATPPTGTVTFLFTDIEGSSRLWERHGSAMGEALERHDRILREQIEGRSGHIFKTVGDAFCAAFQTAADGLLAALAAQQALDREPWGETGPLRVRMGLHTGASEYRDGDYFGNTLNRVARIADAGHGGQLLLSHATVELLRDDLPAPVRFLDLGLQRLRNLSRPEHIFQAFTDGMPCHFPPLRSLDSLPNNLPVQLTSFIGREQESREVTARLDTTRLLTLTGPGGTGKTRLAIEVSATLLDRYPDGVWLVELAPLSDADRVIEAVSTAVGAREEPDRPLRQSLLNYLRSKKLLLVLDNCEHVRETVANLCGELLRACPQLSILTTSRHSLGLPGEMTWPVPPLRVPDLFQQRLEGPDLLERVSQFDAVKLFIDRVTAVRPSFELTADNAAAIAEICFRLDGIPLAVELAAARVRLLTPSQIVERLEDQFRLLRGSSRTALPHQQTLETLIGWSHDLLSDPERVLFRRLGVFVGGRSVEAIERVCSGDGLEEWEVLDLLEQLVDKSLVTAEPDTEGETRYTMLESIWYYARARLDESGETAALRERHLDYYVTLAETAAPGLRGADQAVWIERMKEDRLNLRSALQWAAETPSGAEKGLRLAAALGRFWEVRGNVKTAIDLYEAILARPDATTPTVWLAEAIRTAGELNWVQDHYDLARARYEQAISIYEQIGDQTAAARVAGLIGFLDRGDRQLEAAERRFQRALRVGEDNNESTLVAIGLSGLGSIEQDRGNIAEGRKLKEKSLEIYRELGDRWIIGLILWGVARSALAEGDSQAAREALEETLGIARELGNRWMMPYMLEILAEVELQEGRAEQAARWMAIVERQRESFGLRYSAVEQEEHRRLMARLRESLDPERLQVALADGQTAPLWNLHPERERERGS